jgi:MFS superfamily sulfate permease-like transporter
MRSRLADETFVALAFIWLGTVIGVSFIAIPVCFQVESLSFPVAIELGQVTFHWLSRVEWGFAALLLFTALFGNRRTRKIIAAVLAVVVAAQAAWLLPVLDARGAAIITGNPLPPSLHHTIYAVSEIVKVLLLAGSGFLAVRRL